MELGKVHHFSSCPWLNLGENEFFLLKNGLGSVKMDVKNLFSFFTAFSHNNGG